VKRYQRKVTAFAAVALSFGLVACSGAAAPIETTAPPATDAPASTGAAETTVPGEDTTTTAVDANTPAGVKEGADTILTPAPTA